MTERDYEVIAMQFARLHYASSDVFTERFEQCIETVADILEHNSKRFKRLRFYTDVYGDVGKASVKIQKDKEKRESVRQSLEKGLQ